MSSKKKKTPCKNCPWRKDLTENSIPRYREDLHENLIRECQRDGWKVMACHKSEVGNHVPCAGFMAQVGYDSIGVRLLAFRGGQKPEDYGDGGLELHETLEDTLEAIQQLERKEGE